MLFFFRSHYSLLQGVLSPSDGVDLACRLGLTALGICDRFNFHGLISFVKVCRERDVRPVAAVDISPDARMPVVVMTGGRDGLAALNRLLSEESQGRAAVAADSGEADILGPLHRLLCHISRPEEREQLTALVPVQAAASPLFLQRLADIREIMGADRLIDEGGRRQSGGALFAGIPNGENMRMGLVRAREWGLLPLPFIFASHENDLQRRRMALLRAIDLCVTLDHLPPHEYPPDSHRPGDPAAIRRSTEILQSGYPRIFLQGQELWQSLDASFVIPEHHVFPSFEGLSEDQAFDRLRQLCIQGVGRRYGAMRADIQARLDYELEIIRIKGFASYFLVVQDIVAQTPRTCGRGSSASSIVSYALGITHVDPLKHNLFFERFLNMDRNDPPDIDVDFPWDERDKTLAYVFRRYPGRSAMVADHVTFGPRSSIREPAKALGIPPEEISSYIRLWRLGRADALPEWLRREAAWLRGVPRFLGTHPGGVVITPGPITRWTAVHTSAGGLPVIQWEKDGAEDAGLVKIDILGNRSLGVLRDCIELVGRRHGRRIDWESFSPLDDRPTRTLIEEGRTLGVFYVESPATRQLLQKMRTGDYEHLVVASSIIRPAANRYINEYVQRLHGKPHEPVDPAAEQVLAETHGIMVYQEDVSRVAMAVSGFSPGEADRLRKVLSRKDRHASLESWRARFFQGGQSRGRRSETLEILWEMILSFDGYSFCKPHSASYALLSYKLAWFRLNYPLEFFTAVVNNGGGYYSRQTYLNELRRLGFSLLFPDVNQPHGEYRIVEGKNALRTGLLQVRGLSLATLERILECRNAGSFRSPEDFYRRVHPELLQMRSLILSGALDSLDPRISRPAMFWMLAGMRHREGGLGPELFDYPAETSPDSGNAGAAGDSGSRNCFMETPALIAGDYDRAKKLRDEYEIYGLFLSAHPVSLFRGRGEALARRRGLEPLIRSRQLADRVDSSVYLCGWLVSGKEVYTRGREPMSFVTFEDEFGIFETVFFPAAYRELMPLLDGSPICLIGGRVTLELGALSVQVTQIFPLSRRYWESRYNAERTPPGHTGAVGGGKGDRKAG